MTRMTPSEAFVETLVNYGVTDIFGIVGSAYMDALDIFPAAGIRFIPTVHEQGSAHMADGYARVSGQPGVCIGQNGPGITNFVTAIAAEPVRMRRARALLALELGPTVGAQRTRGLVGRVGHPLRAVEHEIGAHQDESNPARGTGGGQAAGHHGVHLSGELLLLLGRVDRRVGRGVHHSRDRRRGVQERLRRRQFSQVDARHGDRRMPLGGPRHVGAERLDPRGSREQELAPEHPGRPGDQDAAIERLPPQASPSRRLAPPFATRLADRRSDSKVPASVHQPSSTS